MNIEQINQAISKLEDTQEISDGYHTFNELYNHRCYLYLALCLKYKEYCYYTTVNSDGSTWEDWFLLVLNHSVIKQISYHLPEEFIEFCKLADIDYRDKCDDYDGHTSNDVIERLEELVVFEVASYLETLPKPEKPEIKKFDKPILGIRKEDFEKLKDSSFFKAVQKPLE